jgi:hypothetical protein
MLSDNIIGGLAFGHLSKIMFKAVVFANSSRLTDLLQSQLTSLLKAQNLSDLLLTVLWI